MQLSCVCCQGLFFGDPFTELVPTEMNQVLLWWDPGRVFVIGCKSDLPQVIEQLPIVLTDLKFSGVWMSIFPKFGDYYSQWLEQIFTRIEKRGSIYCWGELLIWEGENFFAIQAPMTKEVDD